MGAGALKPVTTMGSSGLVVQTEETEACRRPEAGIAQVGEQVVAAGSGDVVGAPGTGGGDPDQAAAIVGRGEQVQSVAVVLSPVLRAVDLASAALGGDETAAEQGHIPAPFSITQFQQPVGAPWLRRQARSRGRRRSTPGRRTRPVQTYRGWRRINSLIRYRYRCAGLARVVAP